MSLPGTEHVVVVEVHIVALRRRSRTRTRLVGVWRDLVSR